MTRPLAPDYEPSPRWPLLGIVLGVAWLYDGKRLWIGLALPNGYTRRSLHGR